MTGGWRTPPERLMEMLGGGWVCQAICTAATLGIADALAKGPLTGEELAEKLACHSGSLERLMDVLVAEEIFIKDDRKAYALTEIGVQLCTGRLGSLARFIGTTTQWAPWSALPQAIQTGRSAFELVHGEGLYERLAKRPEEAALYNTSVDRFTAEQATALADAYDFSEVRQVVDVGGGRGTLMIEILRRWPHLIGTVLDVPHVAQACRDHLSEVGLADRCRTVGGDFFDNLPQGADIYILKHVLHNWDDQDAVALLNRCRESLTPGGAVLVVEGLLLPGTPKDAVRILDLEMLMLFGHGRERSKGEFQKLFSAAGLRLHRGTLPLGHFARLLIGEVR